MIPGDILSALPHRQFHTLPGLLDSRTALPNSNPSALRAIQGGSSYHFYDGLWYDPAERQTHDLPCERRTRYQLSQPDTVPLKDLHIHIYMTNNGNMEKSRSHGLINLTFPFLHQYITAAINQSML